MRCSTKSSGMATVAVLSVLLPAPGEIAVSPASAAAASQSIPFVPISRRRRSAARAVQHATHREVS
jgi:hypothetical protein